MRKITKFRRSVKAISPVISVLLMIAIAIAGALITYAWVTGYIGFTTEKAGKAIMIQSIANSGNDLVVYVQNVGEGTVELDPDSCLYVNGELKTCTILPADGIVYEGDTATLVLAGGAAGPGEKYTVKVITVFGIFSEKSAYPASAEGSGGPEGEYTLTITTTGDGSVTKNPNQATYSLDDAVELTAIADPGWSFDSWSGDLSGFTNPDTVTVTGNMDITATFTQDEYTLDVTVDPVGSGTVDKSPDQAMYHYNDVVTLTPTANPGYTFDHWSGAGSDGTGNTRIVTVTSNMAVTAHFTSGGYQVSFTQSGASAAPTVEYQIDGGSIVTDTVPFNVAVEDGSVISYTYQATADGGSGTQYVLTSVDPASPQTVTGAITITGYYKTRYQLTMSTNFGTTTPAVGDTWYDSGSTVTISATAPTAGAGERYVWNGWTGTGSGSYTGTDNPATDAVTMNGPITEAASWTHQYEITVTASPSGAIGADFLVTYRQDGSPHTNEAQTIPWTAWADAGTAVTVSNPEDPYDAYDFDHYNPAATVTMTTFRTITLVYTPAQQTLILRPTGTGSSNENWHNGGWGSSNWMCVDDTTPDETYVYDSYQYIDYATDTYDTANHGSESGTITSVTVHIRARQVRSIGNTDQSYARAILRIGTTNYDKGVTFTLTDDWVEYEVPFDTNPAGGAWDWTAIDSMQIGVSLMSGDTYGMGGDGTCYAQCTQVWVEVTYTPPP